MYSLHVEFGLKYPVLVFARAKVGTACPGDTTIRQWMKACAGISPLAMEAVKEISTSEKPDVDATAITLAYLARPLFVACRSEGNDQKQALCLHLLSRYVVLQHLQHTERCSCK